MYSETIFGNGNRNNEQAAKAHACEKRSQDEIAYLRFQSKNRK